jgi:DNA-binding response OmpR family regulator
MGASSQWTSCTRRLEDDAPRRGAACVIEPDEASRTGVSSLLRHMGFVTHGADSGSNGALIAEQTDLAVIVVHVPVTDVPGLKLVKRLRDSAPAALLIVLTADRRALALSRISGADAVLAFPPCGEALCATISGADLPARSRRLSIRAEQSSQCPEFKQTRSA